MPTLSSLLMLAAAIFAGAVVPLQAGANANLGRLLGHPLSATVVSLAVSLALIVPVLIALRAPLPNLAVAFKGPWWIWIGGAAGAIYITAALILAPKLGAASFIVAVIAGQMLVSMLIDHFGLMGFPVKPVNAARLAGLLLIVGGMVITQIANASPALAATTR
ncbi:DMT family transporter [Ensifer sp.]|uniref:DMT family transporter n=1 Tax=Ensifer sp. TaxID=1872086 RepID=UPI002E1329A4|nr:DMT family transporter [Ensifer sp.]